MLRSHGITKNPERLKENHGGWYYEMQEIGYNCRLSDISSALGLSQLSRARKGIEKRRAIARKYTEAFKNTPVKTIDVPFGIGHAYHLYVVQVEDRLGLYNYLKNLGIYAQIHYIPVHMMPFYQDRGWKKGDMPKAEAYYDKCISLPMFPTLTGREQNQIIKHIKNFFYEEVSNYPSERWEQKNIA